MGEQEAPVFDIDLFREMMESMGGVAVYGDIIRRFFDGLPERIDELQAGLDTGDAEAVRGVAHNIAGSCHYIGLVSLRDRLRQIERIAAGGTLEGLDGVATEVRAWATDGKTLVDAALLQAH